MGRRPPSPHAWVIVAALGACNGASTTASAESEPCSAVQRSAMRCTGNDVERCDGSRWSTATVCGAGSSCVAAGWSATCVEACDPYDVGRVRCQDDIAEACDGSAWARTIRCADQAAVCRLADGSAFCVHECTGATSWSYCDGNQAVRCEAGVVSARDCGSGVCRAGGLGYQCLDCLDGAVRCSGDVMEYCDYSAWRPKQDCSSTGKRCVPISLRSAECRAAGDCGHFDEGRQRCREQLIEECVLGAWMPQKSCAPSQRCDASGAWPTCVDLP